MIARYAEWVDSGVPWIGLIPKGWRVKKFRYLFRERSEKIEGEVLGEMLSVSGYRGVEIKVYDDENRKRRNEDLIGYRIVQPGQLVVNTMWLNYAGLGVSDFEGYVSPAYRAYSFVDTRDLYPRFAHHLLRCSSYVQGYTELLTGVRPNSLQMSRNDLMAFPVLLPPLSEQVVIANFLDRETAKIDALVDEQKRLIDLMKEKRHAIISHAVTRGLNPNAPMKFTGMEWLVEVPQHWEVVEIKRGCVLITDGAHVSPETVNGVFPFVSTKDVSDDGINFEDCLRTSAESFELLVRSGCQPLLGDVLFSKDGTIGRTVVVREARDFVVASSLIIIRPDQNVLSPDFLSYLCQSAAISQQVASYVKGAGLPRLSIKNLLRVVGCIPPLEEQREIVTALDEQMLNLDSLAVQAKAAINLLQERRAALISAAVMGRINVQEQIDLRGDSGDVRNAVGFEIVRRLAHRPTFGRVKLQKIIYLAETYAGVSELNGHYQREAAGPLDRKLIADIEILLQQDGEVLIEQPEGRGSAVGYRFVGQRPKVEREELRPLLGHRRERFEQILTKVGDLDTKGAEAVATLFAIWNDALLDRATISDDGIITGFLTEWHPEKPLKFNRDELHTWLGWMRRNGIVPIGQGPRTQTGRLLI